MDLLTWTVSEPLQPRVQAMIIKQDKWNLTTETGCDSNLTVLENTMLIMVCMAAYPIFWHNNNQEPISLEQEQFYGQNDRNFSDNPSKYFLSAIWQYEATFKIPKISNRSEGLYTCSISNLMGMNLSTTMQLRVRSLKKNFLEIPEILQTGFDEIQSPPLSLYHLWTRKTFDSISLIYSIPSGLHGINYTYTNDEGKIYTPNRGFASLYKTDNAGLKPEILSRRVGKLILTLERDMRVRVAGVHVLSVIWQMEKNATVHRDYRFKLSPKKDHSTRKANRFSTNAFVKLPVQGDYEVRMTFAYPKRVTAAWLGAMKQEQEPDQICKMEQLYHSQMADQCGILSFSFIKDNIPNELVLGIQIFMRAINPCILLAAFEINRRLPALESYLFVSAIDDTLFESESDVVKVLTVSGNDTSDADISPRIVNEVLTLRCLVPACSYSYLNIMWCYGRRITEECISFPIASGGRKNKTSLVADPLVRISSAKIGTFTTAYDVSFTSLQKRHSNSYVCMTSSLHTFHRGAPINLSVEDPLEPTFKEGQKNQVDERVLKHGNKMLLSCQVDGLPTPKISWTWEYVDQYNSEENPRIIDSPKNATLEISREGVYECNAKNRYGSNGRKFKVQYEHDYLLIAISVPSVAALASSILLILWWLRNRAINVSFKRLAKLLKDSSKTHLDQNDSLVPHQFYDQNYEIDRSFFTLKSKLLGEGEFAHVFKGELLHNEAEIAQAVAIKIPKDLSNIEHHQALIDEIWLMCRVTPHVNILAFLGACTNYLEKRQLYILTELCEHGSLRDYLIKNSTKFEGTTNNNDEDFVGIDNTVEKLLNYAYQAANGMEYLASIPIFHRDLALRNLLLNSKQIVKIADFGLSRPRMIMSKKSKKPAPIFWMALESIVSGEFTEKSDVWSFGIILWELFNCGRQPYFGHQPDSSFCEWLKKEENRLSPPRIYCETMYQLMSDCWKEHPDDRPTFSQCKRAISDEFERRAPHIHQPIDLNLSQYITAIVPKCRPQQCRPNDSSKKPVYVDQKGASAKTDANPAAMGTLDQMTPVAMDGWMARKENDICEPLLDVVTDGNLCNVDNVAENPYQHP